MSQSELRQKLAELHQALESTPVDEHLAPALRQVADDIQRALAQRPELREDREISQRLNEMISKWEVKHPHITAILSQVTELLASIGI